MLSTEPLGRTGKGVGACVSSKHFPTTIIARSHNPPGPAGGFLFARTRLPPTRPSAQRGSPASEEPPQLEAREPRRSQEANERAKKQGNQKLTVAAMLLPALLPHDEYSPLGPTGKGGWEPCVSSRSSNNHTSLQCLIQPFAVANPPGPAGGFAVLLVAFASLPGRSAKRLEVRTQSLLDRCQKRVRVTFHCWARNASASLLRSSLPASSNLS
jgi:hypothetical protein